MKYGLTILLAALVTASCSSLPTRRASADQILASTKRLTAEACAPGSKFGDDWVSGCSYAPPALIHGEWGVIVRYMLVDKNGNRIPVMGAESIYLFDEAGKFIKILPGM
jgi:hypothetical protein